MTYLHCHPVCCVCLRSRQKLINLFRKKTMVSVFFIIDRNRMHFAVEKGNPTLVFIATWNMKKKKRMHVAIESNVSICNSKHLSTFHVWWLAHLLGVCAIFTYIHAEQFRVDFCFFYITHDRPCHRLSWRFFSVLFFCKLFLFLSIGVVVQCVLLLHESHISMIEWAFELSISTACFRQHQIAS